MSREKDHESFLSSLLENPSDETTLLVYSDWLEDQGDARAAYLRNQAAYRKAPSDELRQRLIEQYPDSHLSWVATLEQAGAVEANLTRFEFAWWGTDIGPARESASTYERFAYRDQPPLPVEEMNGSFDWLTSESNLANHNGARWKDFCSETRDQGYFVPEAFERFLSHPDLPTRIKSCTDNYFQTPGDNEMAEWEDGLFVTFYADSQYCILWGILLPRHPGRYAPVLAGPPEGLFPDDWGEPEDDEEDREVNAVLAASQLEPFLYRWWIENEIWYATVWEETRRPLTPREQAYVDHFHRKYPRS